MTRKQKSDIRKKRRKKNRPFYGVNLGDGFFLRGMANGETLMNGDFSVMQDYSGKYFVVVGQKGQKGAKIVKILGPFDNIATAHRESLRLRSILRNMGMTTREMQFKSLQRAVKALRVFNSTENATITIRKRNRKDRQLSGVIFA